MDVVGDKWAAFTEKQLVLRAARQAKESSMSMQVCVLLPARTVVVVVWRAGDGRRML